MPIYDYICPTCKKEFEATHSITEELEHCPLCKDNNIISDKPKRLISLSSFQLIGGGWASDNYSKK